jgi:hypothetical protein
MRKELGIKKEITKDNKENKKDEFSFVVIDKADFENIK